MSELIERLRGWTGRAQASTIATGLDPVVPSLLPGNADEAHLAARVAAADAYAMDCLRLAHDCRVAPMLFLKCTAQSVSLMREARGARTQLMRIQAERRKREADNATRDQAAWIEHCAIGLMMQAQPAAEPPTDPAAEADLYAVMYPRRAALIRSHGGVPDNVSFGAPADDLARILVTGRTPTLLALDAGAGA
jgi:hypothetical protein